VLGMTNELQLFEGPGHAFLVWPDMPESMEAYRLVASFFERHLGTEGPVVDQRVR
jgi:monoterpene epsilon-lactone hydrolase